VGMAEYFQALSKTSQPVSRLGTEFENLDVELSFFKLLAGIGIHF